MHLAPRVGEITHADGLALPGEHVLGKRPPVHIQVVEVIRIGAMIAWMTELATEGAAVPAVCAALARVVRFWAAVVLRPTVDLDRRKSRRAWGVEVAEHGRAAVVDIVAILVLWVIVIFWSPGLAMAQRDAGKH